VPTHRVALRANEAGNNPSNDSVAAVTTIESTAAVDSVLRLVSVEQVDPPRRRRGSTRLVLTFNRALMASTARNRAFYRLVTAGRDRRFGTRDDRATPLASVALDNTGQIVTLALRSRLNRRVAYRLIVSAGVTDTGGSPLDGDGDGAPGGSATVSL
jgi:hypothetical protein